jgi:DNA-3-methyladenine glycosylase II
LQSVPATLDIRAFGHGIKELASRDPDLAQILSTWGEPPFWTHEAGFSGIVLSILAQQVSLESAEAAFTKLGQAVPSMSPEDFMSLEEDRLKTIGFSRQKASYVRGIAQGMLRAEINLESLETMMDDEARSSLLQLRGIGPWTADTYLLFCLRRADAWPAGDLALIKAIEELKGLTAPLAAEEADRLAETWRPWRAVAARLLWYHYLCSRGRFTPGN